jgi:hypothetical protein
MIGKIHNEEGYELWVALYSQLIENIPKEHFGQLMIRILESADNRISALSTHLFVYIIQNYSNYNLSLNEMMEIIFYCVKSFSYMYNTED